MSERELMKFKAALRAIAESEGIPAQVVLQNFMFERLLARLVKSPIRQNMILKGGLLIAALLGPSRRTTMDLDITVRNDSCRKTGDLPLERNSDDATTRFLRHRASFRSLQAEHRARQNRHQGDMPPSRNRWRSRRCPQANHCSPERQGATRTMGKIPAKPSLCPRQTVRRDLRTAP